MADPYDLSAATQKNSGDGGGSGPAGEPRIVVDSDWKKQAQAEKEKLAAKERELEAKGGGRGTGGEMEPPEASFRTLLGTLASQALLYMGGMPDPETGRAIVAVDLAQHYIDLLGVLEDKTKGNLSEEEATELREVLAELHARFVYVSRAVASAMAQQAAGGGGQGRPGGGPPIVGL